MRLLAGAPLRRADRIFDVLDGAQTVSEPARLALLRAVGLFLRQAPGEPTQARGAHELAF